MDFWQNFTKPIIALSPMDAVTDFAYREVQAELAKPDLIFTEFIPVEGLVRLNPQLLRDFWYTEKEQPIVAQIYGNDPELFYFSAQLVAEMGFVGLDLNMGCPARSVVHRGCGAALIRNPELAKKLIMASKQGLADWQKNGINWKDWPVFSGRKAKRLFKEFYEFSSERGINFPNNSKLTSETRPLLPVSVKTRVGYDVEVVSEWIPHLLDCQPAAISLHGRTLKQLYTGRADWNLITKAVSIRDAEPAYKKTIMLGNGDISDVGIAQKLIQESGVDGILVGRATFGNPWLISDLINVIRNGEPLKSDTGIANKADLRAAMLRHAELHESSKGVSAFVQMRKILGWYIKQFPNASQIRSELVQTNSTEEVRQILDKWQL